VVDQVLSSVATPSATGAGSRTGFERP